LAVEDYRYDTFAQQFEAPHFGFHQTAAMITFSVDRVFSWQALTTPSLYQSKVAENLVVSKIGCSLANSLLGIS
jgi:hypothetical protein